MTTLRLDLSSGIIFAGTRGLASRCLNYIITTAGKDAVRGILGAPRGVTTWWRAEAEHELWQLADQYRIPYYEHADSVDTDAELLVSVMWNKLFARRFLDRFPKGGINFHPAPLPEYRGSFARSHAIINGDENFGVTTHFIAERVDSGDIIHESRFPIFEDETAYSLDQRAQFYGFAQFCEVWMRFVDGSYTRTSQRQLLGANGRVERFYPLQVLDDLLNSSKQPRTPGELSVLYRALYCPPRIFPPRWLVNRLLAHEILSFENSRIPRLYPQAAVDWSSTGKN